MPQIFTGPDTGQAKVTLYDSNGNPYTAGGIALQTEGDPTEKSVTATSSAADIAAANADRTYFSFQNTSKTGYVWVRENANAAVGTGQLLGPGGTYISESKARVSVIKDTGSADCYCFGYEY